MDRKGLKIKKIQDSLKTMFIHGMEEVRGSIPLSSTPNLCGSRGSLISWNFPLFCNGKRCSLSARFSCLLTQYSTLGSGAIWPERSGQNFAGLVLVCGSVPKLTSWWGAHNCDMRCDEIVFDLKSLRMISIFQDYVLPSCFKVRSVSGDSAS